jgi:hypothetical protein
MEHGRNDLNWVWWAFFPPLVLIAVIAGQLFSPALYQHMTARDEINAFGVIENGTILVMLPAIVAGLLVFARRRHLPHWTLGWSTLACALACIYFAGEEASWGQHYFGWEAGERMAEINQQKETNLHNVSTWFNQKPRMVVEYWLLMGGIVLPLWRAIRRSKADPESFSHWFWPTNIVVPTAVLYLFLRSAYWYQDATEADIPYWLYDSETREYYIALYLALYLLSIRSRLNGLIAATYDDKRDAAQAQPSFDAFARAPERESAGPNVYGKQPPPFA